MVQLRDRITDDNPYVRVRWTPEDVRVPIQLRGRPLFIPREFEAGVVSASLHVVLRLEATAARQEIFEVAGQEPPHFDSEVLVTGVEIRTDRFMSAITHDDFRRIPLKKWTRYAVAAAAATRRELRDMSEPVPDGATVDEWLKTVSFAELARTPVGRPLHETQFVWRGRLIDLDDVANVATAGAPHHMKAVQEHFGDPDHPVPRSTAQRWLKRARANGQTR